MVPFKTRHALNALTAFFFFIFLPANKKVPRKKYLPELSLQIQGSKADIRNPLRYLLMNAVASPSVSGSFQLPLTEASPLTRRLVLRALEAGECLSAVKRTFAIRFATCS